MLNWIQIKEKNAINDFEKNFKLINNLVFEKIIENVRKLRDIEHMVTKRRRSYLVLEANYHVAKRFSEYLIVAEMKKKCINKITGLSRSINIRYQQNINVSILVWQHKTKLWRKSIWYLKLQINHYLEESSKELLKGKRLILK